MSLVEDCHPQKENILERSGEGLTDGSMTEYAVRICERTGDPLILADAILREKGIS